MRPRSTARRHSHAISTGGPRTSSRRSPQAGSTAPPMSPSNWLPGRALVRSRPGRSSSRTRNRDSTGLGASNVSRMRLRTRSGPRKAPRSCGMRWRLFEQHDPNDDAAARAGIAEVGSSLGYLWRAQAQFVAGEELAEELLVEIGEPDDVSTARLLALRSIAALSARDDYDAARKDADRALALARSAGEGQLELETAPADRADRGGTRRHERGAVARARGARAPYGTLGHGRPLAPDARRPPRRRPPG